MEEWKRDNLGYLLELTYGKSLPKNKRVAGNIPVYGSNGIVGFHNVAIVNEPGIIVGRKGSAGNVRISKVPFCPIDTTFYITQQHSKLDLEYLYYALNFLDLKRILGDVGVPGLNREMAYLEELFYPSDKAEQRKIAHVLSTVQKAIEQQDKLIRTTTELKKTIMQKLFTEGTRGEPQKETEIGLVPESWEVVNLIAVCEKPQYGFTDSASKEGNAQFLRITDITEFGVKWNEVPYCNCPDYKKYELKNGDIVFARIGATTGKSYLIKNPPKSVYASYLIRVRCRDEILPEFLINYFETEQYWSQINARKGDNLKGGVNGSILSKLFTPKPSLGDQEKMASTFMILDKKIAFSLSKKQTLTDLFKTLLHELMTGQRRVHELEFDEMMKGI
ncbi:hypothetical protein C4E24_03230 [ANME-1 cluster archaeon AG-394-G21]|nr:hypothetical protein [ANME-1 cluster archaeon AG-394-G21]